MQDIKVKRNQQTPKDVKFNALQNGYLGFPKLWGFVPKNQNFDFSKINAKKFQNFIDIQKTEHMLQSYVL